MKTHFRNRNTPLSIAAIAVLLATGLSAQSAAQKNDSRSPQKEAAQSSGGQSGSRMKSEQAANLQMAPENARSRGIKELDGQQVRGANGEQVGTLKDFVVDTKTSRVVLAVVESTNGQASGKAALRILPISGIEHKSTGEGFTTPLDRSEWSKLPAIDAQDFDSGIINLTADQRRQLSGSDRQMAVDLDASADTATASERARSDYRPRLMGASKIVGRTVQANGQQAGTLADVVIHLDRGMALALLDANADFAGMKREFLVPLSRLQVLRGQKDPVTTDLTRADFRRVGSNQSSVATSKSPAKEDQPTPTGRADSSTRPDLQNEIRAVREVWDVHPELSKLNLSVTADNGKLVLRGKAPNSELGNRARDTAQAVTRGVELENQITIENR